MTEDFDLPDGPFTLRELDALGITRAQLRRLLDENVVRRALRSVYVRTDLEDTPELRLECARLVLPPHAVVCDRSAAWLHGVDCFSLSELDAGVTLEVVSVAGHQALERAEVYGGKRALLPEDICEIDGVLVTTPLRTACDLACLRGRRQALGVLDAFRRRHGLTLSDFLRVLPRYARRRGVTQLRELVPLSTPRPESQPESWTRMEIIDEQLPPPDPQVEVYLPDWGWVRLDLAYPKLKIAIEYDGEEFHSSDADRESDEARRDALRRAGWIVIVVRKDGFSGPGREAWIGELKAALAERAPRSGPRSKRIYARGETMIVHRRGARRH